jgi:lipopolysaccharide export LptBFGC system permease protein LptF
MEFYGIVVIIASIVLIMCLIIVGILMQNMSEDGNFPPIAAPCPDNWTVL